MKNTACLEIRNIFMIEFSSNGCPFVDMAHLKAFHIVDGAYHSTQERKTDEPIHIKKIQSPSFKKPSVCIFTKGRKIGFHLFENYKKWNSNDKPTIQIVWLEEINDQSQKELAELAGIEEKHNELRAGPSFSFAFRSKL